MTNKRLNILCHSALAVGTFFLLTGCSDNKKSGNARDKHLPKAAQASNQAIAYIEIDTLMNQYQFCKDNTLLMTKKSESYKAQLNKKTQALQKAAADFQQKMQQGQYTTQQQAEQAQRALQKMQMELQQLQESLSVKFDKEQQTYNNRLRDSIKSFLKDYNKDGRYAMIISKAGDNILQADPALDITKDVVAGLNKRYKKK